MKSLINNLPTKNQILIEGIRCYAFHGCLAEESIIGGEYLVDVTINADLHKSINSDELSDTIDYVEVYNIVNQEMKIRSKLIEHVAGRILSRLNDRFPETTIKIKVVKINPPMNGAVDRVSVILEK